LLLYPSIEDEYGEAITFGSKSVLYSLMYLLGGGGILGAGVIFVIAKMLGK